MERKFIKKRRWNRYITLSVLLFVFTLMSIPCYTYADDVIPFLGTFDYIAYSAVSGINDAPVNSAEHFLHCCSPNYTFTSIKGDLRITSDNHIVMCHDPGFTLNAEGRITKYNSSNMVNIHDLTYDQCTSLEFENTYNGYYVNVCDFETYIRICAENNKNAFITIRDQYISELVNEMMPVIYKYNMQSKIIVNSFTLSSLQSVKAYDPSIRLSWVLKGGTVPDQSVIDTAAQLGNCIVSIFVFPTSMYGGLDKLRANTDILVYAQKKGVIIYAANVENAEYANELVKLGISGAQFNVVPATIRYWGEPVYTWEEDNSAVTATRTHKFDSSRVETETVNTTLNATLATCESNGVEVYTAAFVNPAFTTQTKTVEIAALGHDWSEPFYTWGEDDSVVTATRECKNNADHIESETVNTKLAKIPATCERNGYVAYTANFLNPVFSPQKKKIEITALGHEWGEPLYKWSRDNSFVIATRICKKDSNHVEMETANTTVVTKPATCELTGSIEYSVKFTNPAFSVLPKTEEIPALDHSWSEPVYTWSEDDSTVTAVRICENDAVHVETESVLTSSEIIKLATEDEPGRIQYKASFNNSAFEGQIKIIEIPMLSSKKPIFVSWLLGINPIIVILVGLVFIGGLIVGMVGVFRAKRRRR